ncbi:MAG: FAD-dependent thymidylate synthase, partial [Thermoplasmata archaeon]|nr:FAD-dependent thymidylate synthase [Thermoplasmata archaeon]
MKVKLIAFTPNLEKIAAMAAKLTHTISTPEDLEKTSEAELKKILEQVLKLGHTSVTEHASFTFSISGVSRALTHQLVRHRIASYSQQSQRYVKLKKPSYIIPPNIEKNMQAKKEFIETI